MTTMVSTFDCNARVVASETPGEARSRWMQEPRPAASPIAAANAPISAACDARRWEFFTNPSISSERPGGADCQGVRVAELRTDPLVLGAKSEPPRLGLHSHSVSEPALGLVAAGIGGRNQAICSWWTVRGGGGDVGLQSSDAGFAVDI